MNESMKLAEIREMEQAATPEQWARVDTPDYAEIHVVGGSGENPIAIVGAKCNADFIAHARADIPYLLDTIDRLTAENAELLQKTQQLTETNKAFESDNYNAEMNLSRLTEQLRAAVGLIDEIRNDATGDWDYIMFKIDQWRGEESE